MPKYLVHYQMDGAPVGVWDSSGAHYYNSQSAKAQAYGEQVLEEASFEDWEALLDLWDGKTPNGTARWGAYETDKTNLEVVLLLAIAESER